MTEHQPLVVSGGTRHAVIDAAGHVVNVILSHADFDPGDGLTLHPLPDDSPVGPGDTVKIVKGVVSVDTKAQPAPTKPTIEDRIAALEAKTRTPV